LSFVFDTFSTSRKAMNLKARPKTALVISWNDKITVQVEGITHRPQGAELDAAKAVYPVWPNGQDRESQPNIAYFAEFKACPSMRSRNDQAANYSATVQRSEAE
jgi:hypothetical protein